jgi:hypothetical protein
LLRKKRQVPRTRRPTGLDGATLTHADALVNRRPLDAVPRRSGASLLNWALGSSRKFRARHAQRDPNFVADSRHVVWRAWQLDPRDD